MDEKHELAILSVFNNADLVEHVLGYITDLMHQLNLRLVNRAFRDAYHRSIRMRYKKVKLEYAPAWFEFRDEMDYKDIKKMIYINHEEYKIHNVDRYFSFLRNVAGAKPQKIIVKYLHRLGKILQQHLHDSIINTLIGEEKGRITQFIGMDDICNPGCYDCIDIGRRANDYGPVQMNYFYFSLKHHYDRLIISDYFLDDIANMCINSTTTKEDCLKIVDSSFRSDITCRVLQLNVSERRDSVLLLNTTQYSYLDEINRGTTELPREVIECLLKKWNAKSLILKFVNRTRQDQSMAFWILKNWFTMFRLDDRVHTITPSVDKINLDKVHIDFSDSVMFGERFKDPGMTRFEDQLIANVRRIVSTNHISIRFSHWYLHASNSVQDIVNNLLINVLMEEPQNLKVDICLVSREKDDTILFDYQGTDVHGYFRRREWNEKSKRFSFRLMKHVGRIYGFANDNNCIINLIVLSREIDKH